MPQPARRQDSTGRLEGFFSRRNRTGNLPRAETKPSFAPCASAHWPSRFQLWVFFHSSAKSKPWRSEPRPLESQQSIRTAIKLISPGFIPRDRHWFFSIRKPTRPAALHRPARSATPLNPFMPKTCKSSASAAIRPKHRKNSKPTTSFPFRSLLTKTARLPRRSAFPRWAEFFRFPNGNRF